MKQPRVRDRDMRVKYQARRLDQNELRKRVQTRADFEAVMKPINQATNALRIAQTRLSELWDEEAEGMLKEAGEL